MIDNIVGLACLPVGVILFLNQFGVTKITSLFGMPILLVAALALVAIQVSNILASHFMDKWIILSYIVHVIMAFPAIIYFLNAIFAFPAAVTAPLPMMFASFIFLEGLYSVFF
ncbi:MAG: hypothetical protein V1735_00645 [Nanoarchaeota archaeon]